MPHTTLGRTGLKVSAAGIGTGGFSRLGLKTGLSEEQAAGLIHEVKSAQAIIEETVAQFFAITGRLGGLASAQTFG